MRTVVLCLLIVSGILGQVFYNRRRKSEELVKKSLAEKEILLDEINHRVKNNLQVIISLLGLQSAHADNEEVSRILGESVDRIRTMSLIHDKLYKADDLTKIDLGEYIRDLTEELFSSYSSRLSDINLAIDVEEVSLPVNKAIPFGLIINELLTNSFKYAFPDGMRGEISVELKLAGKDEVVLTAADNGIGFSTDIEIEETETLGLQIINALVRQLDGSLEIDKTKGAKFTIKAPIE
jgi:two-component sensor histidine kinase